MEQTTVESLWEACGDHLRFYVIKSELIKRSLEQHRLKSGPEISRSVAELDELRSRIRVAGEELETIKYEARDWLSMTKEEALKQHLRVVVRDVIGNYEHRSKNLAAVISKLLLRRLSDVKLLVSVKSASLNKHRDLLKVSRQKLANHLRSARQKLRKLRLEVHEWQDRISVLERRFAELEAEVGRLNMIAAKGYDPLCVNYNVPSVPGPSIKAAELFIMNGNSPVPAQAGIYFIWENGRVVYVGQSINLANRLTDSHNKLRKTDGIGFLLVERKDLNYIEALYIGICRPERNGGFGGQPSMEET